MKSYSRRLGMGFKSWEKDYPGIRGAGPAFLTRREGEDLGAAGSLFPFEFFSSHCGLLASIRVASRCSRLHCAIDLPSFAVLHSVLNNAEQLWSTHCGRRGIPRRRSIFQSLIITEMPGLSRSPFLALRPASSEPRRITSSIFGLGRLVLRSEGL